MDDNRIARLWLEVSRPGMPMYVKQTIEVDTEGSVHQILEPMVYLGQAREYWYRLEKEDVAEFFAELKIKEWKIRREEHFFSSGSWKLTVCYTDNTRVSDGGACIEHPTKEVVAFMESLLGLVPFIEAPWRPYL
ncbi:MAG: hypothetical protein LKE40_00750 [Spirochaetia bacterium]|jgi:hypothetical protein|nr:hypothetical protein [Spirochaetia bacterium]